MGGARVADEGVLMPRTTSAVDQRQDGQLRELEAVVAWLLRGLVALAVCFGLLGWWVVEKGCG